MCGWQRCESLGGEGHAGGGCMVAVAAEAGIAVVKAAHLESGGRRPHSSRYQQWQVAGYDSGLPVQEARLPRRGQRCGWEH